MQRGFNVLHPIGWDAFGLPAENAAIKRGADPRAWTYENIAQQKASMRRYACSFDWDRVLHTCDPEYYRWNQWLFLRLFERGLAYRKASAVNWCPKDQTVLANEQVVDGRCERCGTRVTKKKLTQWYFRITDYADRLLDDMNQLEGKWPDRVLTMQRNWIGRSTGRGRRLRHRGTRRAGHRLHDPAGHVVRRDVLRRRCRLRPGGRAGGGNAGGDRVRRRTSSRSRRARRSSGCRTDRPKTGVFLDRYAINPVNGERLPVWAADYVLADYGTGAIMAVPAHDQRDLDFARAFGLPVQTVVATDLDDPAVTGVATPGDGVLVNSGPLDGLTKADAIARITEILDERGTGHAAVNYRLRDWLISRQRFWGTPIPIIHCPSCGEVAGARRASCRYACPTRRDST